LNTLSGNTAQQEERSARLGPGRTHLVPAAIP
jgi:hypothetical protein